MSRPPAQIVASSRHEDHGIPSASRTTLIGADSLGFSVFGGRRDVEDLEVSEALLAVFVVRHCLPCPLNLHPVVTVNLTHSMGWVNHGATGLCQPILFSKK